MTDDTDTGRFGKYLTSPAGGGGDTGRFGKYVDQPQQPKGNAPAMFLSLPDASGQMHAEPSTDYNKPEEATPASQRVTEGYNAAYEEPLGISQENLQKYPALQSIQPGMKALDA